MLLLLVRVSADFCYILFIEIMLSVVNLFRVSLGRKKRSNPVIGDNVRS